MVELRILHGTSQFQAADRLLRRIWNTRAGDDPPVPVDLMCALDHAGGYVGGAFIDGELVAAASGFLAEGGSLHSHIVGVAAEARGKGIGQAIKAHQRQWAAERGLNFISWTFDPLVRRNAFFNLARLGARAERYVPDFYGPMNDGINGGDATDRLLAYWPVHPAPEAFAPDRSAEAEVILDESGTPREPGGAAVLRCATPADAERLRREHPEEAARWRAAQRAALGGALARGYRIAAFTRDGWYVLERAA
ncbi:GNAT family N-acetyltransferase [Sphaerisporangium fuscum]|uniref:GNAT family N-acetyltransferase n=1 Tax=Sphaerisporangium fuscum TaxID=2835868 RepID=UPI001BDDA5C5|nr:GNAT family N-acetyltransferase [Sphaerisporangium fuscum]